jgi:hypothetical protein
MTQEHLHIALNHLPFLGIGIATMTILSGLVLRSKVTQMTGLAIASIFGWMTPLVMSTGEAAYERYKEGPVRVYLDPNVEQALDSHEERAEAWSKVIYLSAFVSTLALGFSFWRISIGRYAAIAAAILGLAAMGSGMWIAESGGRIRRPDFRLPPTMEDTLKNDRHTD